MGNTISDGAIRAQIEILDKKISNLEIGSAQRLMYEEIRKELKEKLDKFDTAPAYKLHKDEDTTCESCQ